MPQITIHYENNETDPELIEQLAKHHGITPEMLVKRFIGKGLEKHFPSERPITDYENLEDLMVRGGFKK